MVPIEDFNNLISKLEVMAPDYGIDNFDVVDVIMKNFNATNGFIKDNKI